jgi:hypothetical protein
MDTEVADLPNLKPETFFCTASLENLAWHVHPHWALRGQRYG